MLVTTPMMSVIQAMRARIEMVSGVGLATIMRPPFSAMDRRAADASRQAFHLPRILRVLYC
jgi:hypothetical protein